MSDFPLFDRAEKQGVFKAEKGWLISAPTATGKSYIGIEVIKRNLPNKPSMEVYLYLVPFKALAEEMYSKLKQELPPETRIHIKTGDYDRPFEPKETDVLVATYESIDGMIQQGVDFFPSIIIADEFSIISDGNRGARIESLISYLAKFKGGTRLYALSAVLCDPERISKWLGTNVLLGDENDRRIKLETKCIPFPEGRKGDALRKLVKNGLRQGNFLIFCERKKDAEKLCHELKDLVTTSMKPEEVQDSQELVAQLKYDFPYLVDFPELLANGVAFHHADLEVDLRNRIAEAFRRRKIKVVAATTTLSAGVNLPARFVIVRDVTRYESGRKLLPVSEMVNMLGRSGRPGYDKLGTGYFLVQKEKASEPVHKEFISKVKKCKVEELYSQIPESMTNILQFILGTAARFKGVTRDELISVYNTTLWGFENPLEHPFLSGENLTSRIEKILKSPEENVRIDESSVQVAGGVLYARGGTRSYEIRLSEEKSTCECPAYQWRGMRPCKHVRQLQFDAIVGNIGKRNQEGKAIAIASFKNTGLKQDPMYMLSAGADLLLNWQFLAENEGKLVITRDGRQALVNYLLEMDHVRLLRDRIRKGETAKNDEDIIKWAIEDYRIPKQTIYEIEDVTEQSDLPKELAEAVWKHIENKSYKQILPQKYIQRFLDAKDRLDQIFNAYLAFSSNENKSLAWLIRTARRRVHYGCMTELLPLMVLDIEAIDEVSKAQTLFKNGVRNVTDLSRIDPNLISKMLKIPEAEASKSVQTAGNIIKLVSEFSGDRAQLNTLAARTGVKIEDLLDYLLQKEMADKLRT